MLRLAQSPGGLFDPRTVRRRYTPLDSARLLQLRRNRRSFRTPTFFASQTDRSRRDPGNLLLFALLALGGLQRPARSLASPRVLSGHCPFSIPGALRRFSSALFHEHTAHLVSGAAVPVRCAQR